MDWFRSWHGAPTDTAFLVIARRAQVAPGMVSAVYWALLDYASQNNPRGSIAGFDAEAYAEWAGWEESQITAIIAAFQGKGKITEAGEIVAWADRQPKREDDSAPRVKAFRDRQKALQDDVTHGNAVKQNVTLDKIREDSEERREEPEAEPEVAPAGAAPKAKPARVVTPGGQADMFGAITETCQLDAKLKQGQIARASKALLEAGYTPVQVRAFASWWKVHDWRGQRGNVPTIAQLQELIKQSTIPTNGADPVRVQRGAWNSADQQSADYKRKMAALLGD